MAAKARRERRDRNLLFTLEVYRHPKGVMVAHRNATHFIDSIVNGKV